MLLACRKRFLAWCCFRWENKKRANFKTLYWALAVTFHNFEASGTGLCQYWQKPVCLHASLYNMPFGVGGCRLIRCAMLTTIAIICNMRKRKDFHLFVMLIFSMLMLIVAFLWEMLLSLFCSCKTFYMLKHVVDNRTLSKMMWNQLNIEWWLVINCLTWWSLNYECFIVAAVLRDLRTWFGRTSFQIKARNLLQPSTWNG